MKRLLLISVLLTSCRIGDCSEQTCSEFGGSAERTFTSCFSSGIDSTDEDEFWLEDDQGEQFFECRRPADDNDGCGVALNAAKTTYCSN